jgi:secreted Zn-dependent insulinase-like peptidase
MTQEEFSSRKLAQWKVWNTTETDIEKQGEKYWNEILHGHYNFERNHQKQEILNQLTLQELETFYDVNY